MLLTADNLIDPATGTVKLKAQFPNTDNALFPSQFANVRMLVDVKRDAVLVPNAAVQRGTPGTFVYVVSVERTVSVRKVKLGPAQGEVVAIETGLAAGETVVVDGADKLREGAKVEASTQETRAAKAGARKGVGERKGAGGAERKAPSAEGGKAAAGAAAPQAATGGGGGGGFQGLSPEERARRWAEMNARIDRGEFGEEIKKLPEDERKQRMRELRQKREAAGGNAQ